MVYRAPEIEDLLKRINIRFEEIPSGILSLLGYNSTEYLRHCWLLNQAFWNITYWYNDYIWALLWGQIDPIDKLMHVSKLIIHPAMSSKGTKVYKRLLQDVREYGSQLDVDRIYWITDRPKVFLRKLDGYVTKTDATVIEVL